MNYKNIDVIFNQVLCHRQEVKGGWGLSNVPIFKKKKCHPEL